MIITIIIITKVNLATSALAILPAAPATCNKIGQTRLVVDRNKPVNLVLDWV